MSEENLTKFTCYQGGEFYYVGSELCYNGGETSSFECQANQMMSVLMGRMDLYQKTVWYILPYEDINARKSLRGDSGMWEKFLEQTLWVNSVILFVSPTDVKAEDIINKAITVGERDADKTNVAKTEDRNEENDGEMFPEEVRVESAVAGFFDEPEDDGELHTPINSDFEGDEDDGGHCTYRKGSGELRLGQFFGSINDFKEAVVDYVLKEGWNIEYGKSETVRCLATCGSNSDCPWRCYCSFEVPLGKYKIKTFEDTHTCVKNGHSTIINQTVLANLFVNDFRYNPSYMPSTMQEEVQRRWKIVVTSDQCKKAKRAALDLIELEYAEQFSRLKDYRLEILESNPGSSCHLDTIPVEGKGDMFYRFYVCFEVLKTTWRKYCRPIIGIDGCFLKCTMKGQLLAAVGRDSNNQMYPVAWAVVDVENEDNWRWFVNKIKTDLCLGDGEGFALISDRQKGLLNAVQDQLPKIEHRMCARHIYGNLKKAHPNKPEMKKLFWKVAKSYSEAEYKRKIEAVREYDRRVYEDMMAKNPRNCSRAFFSTKAVCDDVHNNISESFNHAIDAAREMPMVEMLETIRRRAMIRIDLRYKKTLKHTGRVSIKATKCVALEQSKICFCRVFPGCDGWYQVQEKGQQYKVNMRRHTCSCRKWDMCDIPCRHALKIISDNKWNVEDFISDWYSIEMWKKIYGKSILPLNGSRFWKKDGSAPVEPPPKDQNDRKTKAQKKRKKGVNESPTKKTKVSRKNRIMHCSKCGVAGHKATTCTSKEGVAKKWPPKKKKKKTQDSGGDVSCTQNSSQPTQNSVNS